MAYFEPPRTILAALPTPLIKLDRLGTALDGADLWLKRDDLTGLELSGNKVRKLEYVLADALHAGCDTVITEGTGQSNHCRATAAACRKLGLQAILLLRPPPPDDIQGNHLLDLLFDAETRCYPRDRFEAEREAIVANLLAELEAAGRKGRYVPTGASEPVGCWGYVRAMAELSEQLQAAGIAECDVVLAVSSGGTFAGAVLGRLLHGMSHVHLWGVPVSDDAAYHTAEVGRLCRATIAQYDLDVEFDEDDLHFLDGYVGEGYAIPYPAALDASRLLARTEAVVLDPVYTAKAFCALIDGVAAGRFGRQRPVVFVHTGGIFSVFAWPQLWA